MDYESMTADEFRDLGIARREAIYAKTMNIGSMLMIYFQKKEVSND